MPDIARLLQHDEQPPVRVLRPAGRSDLFLTADHAGRAIPRQLGSLGLPKEELVRHIAWDIGIATVTEHLSAATECHRGASALLAAGDRLQSRPVSADLDP